MELQPLDFVLLGGVILLAGIGLFRGLSGELGSIAGFAAASFAGFCLLDAARACAASFGFGDYAAPAAYVMDFVFALVAFGIARWVVAKFVSVLVPQPTDAFLGMLGGLFKSAVVLGLLTGVGLMQAGTYSTGFFATRSTVVREIAAWADANLAETRLATEEP
ncbi:MAG: CvpA family protein [Kiritimatiellae bacterium]|nr:CvpA family protein [Kiritimatiellia bacterium]